MFDFTDKKVVISGATRGIGRAIAEAFLDHGARVIGLYGHDSAAAEEFIAARPEDGRLELNRCDVASAEEVGQLFSAIEERYDTIDIMVNSAGIRRDAVLAMMSPEDWQRVIEVNLSGSYLLARQATLLMLKQKYGRIILISSPMSYLGFPGQANYAASKAGQIGLMRSLAKETARRGITVNCVSPGFIDTDFLAGIKDEQLKAYRQTVPMKRFGRSEEVADLVLFLASSRASYITGSVMEINGGL